MSQKMSRLGLALILAFCVANLQAGDDSSQTIEVFYRLHPDLKKHKDIVGVVLSGLVIEKYRAPNNRALYARIASDARKALQAKVPSACRPQNDPVFDAKEEAARNQAKQDYPTLLVPNSPLEIRVRQERENLARTYPAFFANPEWPVLLTQGCAAALQEEANEIVATNQTAQEPDAPRPELNAEQLQMAFELFKKLQALNSTSGGITSDIVLTRNDRIRMLYILRATRVIPSVRAGEDMSDAQLIALYNRAQEELRLQHIENQLKTQP